MRDISLAMSPITDEQKTAMRLYLEEVWTQICLEMAGTHPMRALKLHPRKHTR